MKHWLRGITGWVALAAVVAVFGPATAAQETATSGEAVDPALCTVEPRTVDELVEIFMSGDYVLDESIAAGDFPQGEPPDDATIAAINETLRQVIACENAGNYRAIMALLTDEGVHYLGPEENDATEADIRQFFAETPVEPLPEEERTAFTEATGFVVLDDGRIGALWSPPGTQATYIIFAESGGRYLIDSVTEVETTRATPGATPAG